MWSVGVVVYLLLVGHNPFNAALKQKGQKAIEEEVIKLVSRGEFDASSSRWRELPQDARDFILTMLVVQPAYRISATEASRHPYLLRTLARCSELSPPEPAWRWADREDAWSRLDGFQRLAWAAVSRAVCESELSREVVAVVARAMRSGGNTRGNGGADSVYIWHLARELSATSVHNWLADTGCWNEVLRLSFRYLDNDDDGILSPKDLVSHLVSQPQADARDTAAHADAWSAAHLWVSRWCYYNGNGLSTVNRAASGGLTPANFRAALLACHQGDNSRMDQLSEDGFEGDDLPVLPTSITGREEEELCGWGDMWRDP
jgi:hypothetical protein